MSASASSPPPSGRRQPFHLLAKPTGAACNLDCTYSFFLSKDSLYGGRTRFLPDALLPIFQPDSPARRVRAAAAAEEAAKMAQFTIPIGSTNELLLPILEVMPLQLLAYHIAVKRGCDVDQPRNLAKSVTVE